MFSCKIKKKQLKRNSTTSVEVTERLEMKTKRLKAELESD